MQSFEWIDATSVEQAVALLGAGDASACVVAKAGGVDLIDLMKEGIVSPTRVINLKSIPALHGIQHDAKNGLRMGAMVALAEIAANPIIKQHFTALAQASSHAATPQVRNVATIGGNLLQRPRCWYFRNAQLHSVSSDVDRIRVGEHQYHGIIDNATTPMVHASTLATALIAYGAGVHLCGPRGVERSIPLQDFLLPPVATRDRDADIAANEVLTHITVPALVAGTLAAYHKQTERDSYDWPILDVAVVLQLDGRIVKDVKIVLGGVAPTPLRAVASEKLIKGRELNEAIAREAARAAVQGATPFERNAYKVKMLEVVVGRILVGATGLSV